MADLNKKLKNLITTKDISNEGILSLFTVADLFSRAKSRTDILNGAIGSLLFYEPSTRTRMSFESAMLNMGGRVISMDNPASSSAVKGEILADTIRIVNNYADIIVLRHFAEGAAAFASCFTDKPVINAGDGAHEHPTQTLLDLYTIYKERGSLENLNIALCGDLRYGRTVHSLAEVASRFGAKITCIAPDELQFPSEMLTNNNISATFYTDLNTAPLEEVDILYVTRVQRERFSDLSIFERVKNSYYITLNTMNRLKKDALILHPLPRVDEMDYAIDQDSRSAYFRQAANGVPVRSALIAALLGVYDLELAAEPYYTEIENSVDMCKNPHCITVIEPNILTGIKVDSKGIKYCRYCEKEI